MPALDDDALAMRGGRGTSVLPMPLATGWGIGFDDEDDEDTHEQPTGAWGDDDDEHGPPPPPPPIARTFEGRPRFGLSPSTLGFFSFFNNLSDGLPSASKYGISEWKGAGTL